MPTLQPCSKCQGLGHVCKDEDPFRIHQHDPAVPCKTCGGRGLVPIEEPEAVEAAAPEEA